MNTEEGSPATALPMDLQQLLMHAPPAVTKATVTIWGKTAQINVRRVTFREAAQMNAKMFNSTTGKMSANGLSDYRAELLAATLVNDEGQPLYNAENVYNFDRLLVEAIERAVNKANGIGEEGSADAQKK